MKLGAGAVGVGLGLALLGSVRCAHAFERQWHVGLAGGAAGGNGLTLSPAFGAYGAYGLSDVFDLRLELTARAYHLGSEHDPHQLSAMLGLCYKLDVLSWVPWAGVYLGYQGFLDPPRAGLAFNRHDAALGMGVGLDYTFSRKLGFGVTLRSDSGLSRKGSTSFDGLLRAEYRWGW